MGIPEQYLGFSLQVNRLLAHLLRAEAGDSVSLEVLGDVAVVAASESTTVEEVKSRTSKSNPKRSFSARCSAVLPSCEHIRGSQRLHGLKKLVLRRSQRSEDRIRTF